ncbi:ComEA family DNA-binding protein [Cellulomonas sp.]|uniref:ComEA family DNA-binding protein n=1 Tax=Cellulomonas sp. TaxID=40001 RepID=UPI002D76106D|nr:ComEA family DNA-binding protein [Cellulomonas sp.]HYQ75711.1 ComEA family DNA-binding protein [Cellulomonas sp.]
MAPGPGYDDGRGAPGPTGAGGSAGSGYADDGDVGSYGLGIGDDGGSRGLGHADEVSSPDLGHDDGERAVAGPGVDDEPERAERPRLADVVRWRLAPRTAAIALGALLLVGGAVALRSAAQPTGDPVAVEEPAVTRGAADTEGATTDGAEANGADAAAEDPTVWVHVVGRVAAPGVVALPEGSRVGDAVAAAGGALPDADLAGLNLAAVVQDGAQIRVPAPGEEPPADADDGSGGLSGPGGGGGSGGGGGAVDVNTAGSAELQTLPGIGPVLADRIVAWRDANGPFPDVDALLDVSGIGPAVLGKIRDLVRV